MLTHQPLHSIHMYMFSNGCIRYALCITGRCSACSSSTPLCLRSDSAYFLQFAISRSASPCFSLFFALFSSFSHSSSQPPPTSKLIYLWSKTPSTSCTHPIKCSKPSRVLYWYYYSTRVVLFSSRPQTPRKTADCRYRERYFSL